MIKAPAEEKAASTEIKMEPTNNSYIILIIMLVVAIAFYFYKRNRFSAKATVRKQFAHIESSNSQQQIGLYHRHQQSTDTIIDVVNIVNLKVRLNDNIICEINQKVGHGFDHEKEQSLRIIFAKEQADKMVPDKVRQVNLTLTDINKKSYVVCLYMRKGSNRVTKKTYLVVVDDLIDWCWLIAAKINPDETEKRKMLPKKPLEPVVDLVKERRKQKPRYEQAAAICPANQEALKTPQGVKGDEAKADSVSKEADKDKELANEVGQSKSVDTELVNALEKLVNLKQQGYLTDEEFTKAKENLLSSLFDK